MFAKFWILMFPSTKDDIMVRYAVVVCCSQAHSYMLHIMISWYNKMYYANVRDHRHFTGQFRGAAHQSCNLNYKISRTNYKLSYSQYSFITYEVTTPIISFWPWKSTMDEFNWILPTWSGTSHTLLDASSF